MLIISSREFRQNQKMYFEKVDKGEHIIVQRGKDKAYALTPVTENDLYLNSKMIERLKQSILEVESGETKQISTAQEISDLLGMKYTLEFSKIALEDIEKHKKAGDKATLKKIQKLLNELMEHPTTGTGQPEMLKHNLRLYSRRINQKHRLVYSIKEELVIVYVWSAHSH